MTTKQSSREEMTGDWMTAWLIRKWFHAPSPPPLLHFCRGCWFYCRVTRCRGIRITGIQQPWVYKGQKTQALLCLITSAFILPAVLHGISAGSPGHQSTRAHQYTLQITGSPGHTLQRLCLYTTQCRHRIKHCTGVPLSETVEHCTNNTQKNRLLCWAEYIDRKGRQKEGGHTEEFMLLDPKFIETNTIACN